MPFRENSPDPEGEFPLDTPQYLLYLIFLIDAQRDVAFAPILERFGLTTVAWRALSVIRRLEGCTMKTLAAFTAIDRTTLTRAVDQLVERGLVERKTPPKDRRKVSLTLTPAGDALNNKVVPELVALNARVLKGISPARQRETARTLAAILRATVADPELAESLVTFGRPKAS